MKKIALFAIFAAFMMVAVGCKDKSPAGVCEHAASVVDDEEAKDPEKCEKFLKKFKEELGEEKWDKFADCALDAEDEDGFEKCMESVME